MNKNAHFIDGRWYENEYTRGEYHRIYIEEEEPLWAKQAKDYHNILMVAYTGIKPDAKILDVGAGVGQNIQSWFRLGFKNIVGIEISKTAVEHGLMNPIVHGSAANMSMFNDKQFDIVTSHAFFEHVDESILGDVLSECDRVGRMQAHTIGIEKGDDPSHINMKTMDEWVVAFWDVMKADDRVVFYMPDVLMNISPVIVCMRADDVPYPVAEKLRKYQRME